MSCQQCANLIFVPQPEPESFDNPTSPDGQINNLTRTDSSASLSTSSVVTNDSTNSVQKLDKDTNLIRRADPLAHEKSAL